MLLGEIFLKLKVTMKQIVRKIFLLGISVDSWAVFQTLNFEKHAYRFPKRNSVSSIFKSHTDVGRS